jgi:hypothetical protein
MKVVRAFPAVFAGVLRNTFLTYVEHESSRRFCCSPCCVVNVDVVVWSELQKTSTPWVGYDPESSGSKVISSAAKRIGSIRTQHLQWEQSRRLLATGRHGKALRSGNCLLCSVVCSWRQRVLLRLRIPHWLYLFIQYFLSFLHIFMLSVYPCVPTVNFCCAQIYF